MGQLGAALRDGDLRLEADLVAGRVRVAPAWTLVVEGAPVAHIAASAREGKITSLTFHVEGGRLILSGSGLRPDIVLEEITADASGTIGAARFHGHGFGKLVVSLFHGLAMKSVRKMKFHTEIPELLQGNLIVADRAPGKAPPAPAPKANGSKPETAESGSARFMALVGEVRMKDAAFSAFGGRRLSFGDFLTLETAAEAAGQTPLQVLVSSAFLRPAHGETPGAFGAAGALDGRLARGEIAWGGDRLGFSSGRISGARFTLESGGTHVTAKRLELALTTGLFRGPGGVRVGLSNGSTFAVSDLDVTPSGKVSGRLDLDLRGETGEIRANDSTLELKRIHLVGRSLAVVDSRGSGNLDIDFEYKLRHPFVVRYPVAQLTERSVPLDFEGPLEAHLHVADLGASSDAAVTGTYAFSVAWDPIEKAAFEALSARWVQDISTVKDIGFAVDPKRFAPCGGTCFIAAFKLTVTKGGAGKKKKSLLSEVCEPEGRANLLISKEARSFVLHGIKIEPKCEGALGWLVDLIAPMLTKTYEDITLFSLPQGLPFTIEEVRGGGRVLEVAGKIDWQASEGGR